MTLPPVVRIPAPAVAADPPPPGFPVVATLAPIVLSGVLFALTGSPLMLVMAGLGPVLALAGFLDGRRRVRRARRDAAVRFASELATCRDEVERAHAAERRRRQSHAELAPRWGCETVVLATARGDVPSGVELSGVTSSAPADDALERLVHEAGTLRSAPVLHEASGAYTVTGSRVLAAAVARTLALRLAARLSPADAVLRAPGDESWASCLPHAVETGAAGAYRWSSHDRTVTIGFAAPEPGAVEPGAIEPGAVAVPARDADATTRVAARAAAERLAVAARSAGLRAPGGDLPDAVALATLLAEAPGPRPGLAAPVGVGADGVAVLDLVADGPHAVVAGTTGSGKSELLVTWVLGMAAARTPAQVAFVLVDFKGGASFGPLADLPHVLGIVSDLDERLARRAIESLRAEVLRRERVLADARVRAIDELPHGALARLVVVVDEFAALLADRGELHALFADLAARGRSLGIHLVLCTQRPAGVVRDAVLANIAVRVALRVADAGDSRGLLGDDTAARLPASPRGRAVIVDGSGARRTVQIALATPDDVARVAAAATASGVDAPRPWCDPLPAVVPAAALPSATDGIPFGLLDLPAEQRQPAAVLRPSDGHLLVLGASGAGVSTTLAALAAGSSGAARMLPSDPVDLWAVLAESHAIPDGTILLADDLDLTLARTGPDHAPELADLLGRLLRDGPARGIRIVAGARRLAGPLGALAPSFASRLLLRLASREEHVLAGGEGSAFDPRATPGAGLWRGAVVQVALADPGACRALEVPPPSRAPTAGRGALAVVAARPRELARRWEVAGVPVRMLGAVGGLDLDPAAAVVLGDPDAWQADWAELTRARRELPIVVVGCGVADLRALTRSREVPPPLKPGEVWLVEQGEVRRAVFDDPRAA